MTQPEVSISVKSASLSAFVQRKAIIGLFLALLCFLPATTSAVNFDASQLNAVPQVFFSPATASVLEGSTFDVSVFVNTKQLSINTIELHLAFDPNKMIIVSPSAGKSIIGIWVQPPTYSNSNGTVTLSGVIPGGITTGGGLITTITFKAIATGNAAITIGHGSRILANDGLGSEVQSDFGRAQYSILTVPPEGPQVFSDTHPFSEQWYNNNSPVFGWIKNPDFTDFSYLLDNKPFTVPDNNQITQDTSVSFPNLQDGLWYFHVKAKKQGVWGKTTHFLVRIDTTAPAAFSPKVEALNSWNRALISFFTTDDLSGVDHYEVGVLQKSASAHESPVFVQTESPYQLPLNATGDLKVVVRAFDKAGNVKDAAVDVFATTSKTTTVMSLLRQNLLFIILFLLVLVHFFFRHKIIAHTKRIFAFIKQETL